MISLGSPDHVVASDGHQRTFLIAKNPRIGSRLPYLLRLPLTPELWLAARETWPYTSSVYCHQIEPPVLADLEFLDVVIVDHCDWRGQAIDLILQRRLNRRSQFIFTASRGRPAIFWQTAKTVRQARPGLRILPARHTGLDVIYVDTRERRYGYTFAAQGQTIEYRPLTAGDYAIFHGDEPIALVERKSFNDFIKSLVDGSLMFQMSDLTSAPVAAVVVEGTYSAVLRHRFTQAGFLPEIVARLTLQYPRVSINFLDTRKVAEEWTFRFLRTAFAAVNSMSVHGLPANFDCN